MQLVHFLYTSQFLLITSGTHLRDETETRHGALLDWFELSA